MSNKAECPACKSYLSAIWDAKEYGSGGCPNCGLPGTAIAEVYASRRLQADKALTERYEQVVIRAGKAEAERDLLRRQVRAIREALELTPEDEE